MSSTKIVIIVLSVCIVFILAVGAFALLTSDGGGANFNLLGNRVDINESASLPLTGIKAVSVQCKFGNIVVEAGSEASAELKGYLTSGEKKSTYLQVSDDSGTLNIKFDPGNLPLFGSSDIKLTVLLPKDLMAGLTVSDMSGNIGIQDLNLSDLSVTDTSGNVTITACTGKALNSDVTSGNTTISGAVFDSIKVNCVSGHVRVENTSAALSVNGTSGNIDLKDVKGTLLITDSSGNVDIDNAQQDISAISINILSGNATLHLIKSVAFSLDAGTTSGNVNTDFDMLVSGGGMARNTLTGTCNGGGAPVKISITSGNINIIKK